MKINKVYLIGAGPGDPGLITVRGLEILRQADVIIYDYLIDKRILEEVKPDAELICCDKVGKDRYSDGFLIRQDKINNIIVEKVRSGRKVARLKNGDPCIFGRLSQELDSLVKNKIEFEIVPGVTAASAASSIKAIPLTDRRFASSCVFVTGHEDPKKGKSSLDWEPIAKNGTIVLYMAVENLSEIINKLLKAGKDKFTPVAVVQDIGLPTQKAVVGTLKDIVGKVSSEKIRPPAIVIIGETVRMEKSFRRLNRHRQVLFTGLSKERFFTKGTYLHLPLIKIFPLDDYTEFDNYLKNITGFDWIVFCSRYGVEYFFKRLRGIGYDARVLKHIKVAAIGNSTRIALEGSGILADLVPEIESSLGLLREFKKLNIKGKEIFLPRSDISDKGMTQGLEKLQARVTSSAAYRNVAPEYLPDLDLANFDEIMFTSPSTVRNFKKRYKEMPKNIKIRCIGDVTRAEIEKK